MIKQLFPLLVAASASSWIDFRIRMLLTVMERLSEETLDRFEELEIMALRDGVEKGLLSESGITGSSVGGGGLRERYEKLRSFFNQQFDLIDKIDNDVEVRGEINTRMAQLADTYTDSIFTFVTVMPVETPRLAQEFKKFQDVLDGWYKWTVEFQLTTAHELSIRIPGIPELDAQRAAISSVISGLERKLRDSVGRILSIEEPERTLLDSVPEFFKKLKAAKITLDVYFDQVRMNLSQPHMETSEVVKTGKEFLEILLLIIDSLQFVAARIPDEHVQFNLMRRILDLNIREARIVAQEITKFISDLEFRNTEEYYNELYKYVEGHMAKQKNKYLTPS